MPAQPPGPRDGERRRVALAVLAAFAIALALPGSLLGDDPVDEFHPATDSSSSFADAQALILGPDGALWLPMPGGTGNHVGRLAADGTLTVFTIDGHTSNDTRMAVGSDGAIWFTQWAGGDFNRLGRIETNGASSFIDLPPGSRPTGIASGPDGALWIAANEAGDVIEVEPFTRALTRRALPAGAGRPVAVVADPGSNGVWVSADAAHLVHLDPSGVPLADIPSGSVVQEMVAGPDGRLWLSFGTEGNPVGRLEPDGSITRFAAGGFAFGLAFDTLGRLWIANRGPAELATIQRLDPATGVLTEVAIPSVNGNPSAVALGPDDQIWFVESRFAADPATPNVGRETIGRALTGAPIAGSAPPDVAVVFPGPLDLLFTPESVAAGTTTTVVLALLLGLPTKLFNSTLSRNLPEARRLFGLARLRTKWRRLRRPSLVFAAMARRFGRTVFGALAYLLLLGVVFWFREPATGQHAELLSLAATLFVIATMAVVAGAAGSFYVRRVRKGKTRFRAAFWTLLIALACVIISRVTDARPGYIFGIVALTTFTVALTPRDKGIITQRNMTVILAVGIVAWFVRVPFQTTELHPDVVTLSINRVLVGIFIAAVETTLFGLIPLRFMAGDDLLRWSARSWAILWIGAILLFTYVILLPPSNYVPSVDSAGFRALAVTVAIYNAIAILFWAYFAVWRPRRRSPAPPSAHEMPSRP